MKKGNNVLILENFAGFDFKARVKVSYDNMKDKSYKVHEIVGTRVTINNNRLVDFNINEVELIPVGYSPKESQQIRSFFHN